MTITRKESYDLLLQNTFILEMNCNDFFAYACAWSLRITDADVHWMMPIIQTWKQDGLNACLSYVANREPIKPHITSDFIQAIEYLQKIKPSVYADIDYTNQYYKQGNYREFNTFE